MPSAEIPGKPTTKTRRRSHLALVTNDEPHVELRLRLGRSPLSDGRVAALQLADEIESRGEWLAGLQRRVAEASRSPWLTAAIRANARLTRAVERGYATTTRDALNG